MKLPALYTLPRSQVVIRSFGGYNHTTACEEGEYFNGENLSARSWPALCPRLPRRRLAQLQQPHGLYAKNGLIWVDGDTLYYKGMPMGTVQDNDKTFCGIGAKVLIWPDKLCFDTTDGTLRPLGAQWTSAAAVRFAPARIDSTEYTVRFAGPDEPEAPENGDYWLDTSGEADVLRVYAAASASWAAVSTPYVRIEAAGIGKGFAKYDAVTLSGIRADVLGQRAAALNTDCVIWDKGEDFITVTGLIDKGGEQTAEQGVITVERCIPDLDFLTECDNRVWGVARGGHEIHACKLGDPTNWYCYMGTAADSYTVSVGSDGDFTGAATCMGYVLLFKENTLHRVYGSKPANYQVVTVPCQGVKAGCEKSLANVDSTLCYYSPDGPMACDGGLPEAIGRALGASPGRLAAAGAAHGCYYLSMKGGRREEWSLFCYDMTRGIWHREDGVHALYFAADGSELLFLNAEGEIWVVGSETSALRGGAGEGLVSWYAETGKLGLREPGHQFVTRVELRLEAAAGATAQISVQYDSTGRWVPAAVLPAGPRRSATVPLSPRRCEQFRLRIEGRGQVTLHALTRTYVKGSEL